MHLRTRRLLDKAQEAQEHAAALLKAGKGNPYHKPKGPGGGQFTSGPGGGGPPSKEDDRGMADWWRRSAETHDRLSGRDKVVRQEVAKPGAAPSDPQGHYQTNELGTYYQDKSGKWYGRPAGRGAASFREVSASSKEQLFAAMRRRMGIKAEKPKKK